MFFVCVLEFPCADAERVMSCLTFMDNIDLNNDEIDEDDFENM